MDIENIAPLKKVMRPSPLFALFVGRPAYQRCISAAEDIIGGACRVPSVEQMLARPAPNITSFSPKVPPPPGGSVHAENVHYLDLIGDRLDAGDAQRGMLMSRLVNPNFSGSRMTLRIWLKGSFLNNLTKISHQSPAEKK